MKSFKNNASSSNLSNENITLDNLEDMSFELTDNTNTSINFEVDLNANILDEFKILCIYMKILLMIFL